MVKIKVNLGSGPSGVEFWDNLDWGILPLVNKIKFLPKLLVAIGFLDKNYLTDWPKIRLVDIRKVLPYFDNRVDYVYCSHVLEHFERNEAKHILKEVRRVLKKNGLIRLVIPDLRLVMKIADADEICSKWWGYDMRIIQGWKRWFVRGHKWMYDRKSLEKILKEVGFEKIRWQQFRQGVCPDIDQLDLSVHRDLSLYVEVEK